MGKMFEQLTDWDYYDKTINKILATSTTPLPCIYVPFIQGLLINRFATCNVYYLFSRNMYIHTLFNPIFLVTCFVLDSCLYMYPRRCIHKFICKHTNIRSCPHIRRRICTFLTHLCDMGRILTIKYQ